MELQFHPDPTSKLPKHVEFYFKNKLEKLVHLVGFIIRIYHDARSPECQAQDIRGRNCVSSNLATLSVRSANTDKAN